MLASHALCGQKQYDAARDRAQSAREEYLSLAYERGAANCQELLSEVHFGWECYDEAVATF
jgi:hypothetical protein